MHRGAFEKPSIRSGTRPPKWVTGQQKTEVLSPQLIEGDNPPTNSFVSLLEFPCRTGETLLADNPDESVDQGGVVTVLPGTSLQAALGGRVLLVRVTAAQSGSDPTPAGLRLEPCLKQVLAAAFRLRAPGAGS
ncbi:hypothetical protein GCM10010207_52170 [Streptomyces atratus]|nr:hypothetical protein GCM10010207_52170 [Streptomyces atratus]